MKTQKRTDYVKFRATEEEKKELKTLAKAHGFKNNVSEYLRQAGLQPRITNRANIEIISQLAKINADQVRLGNLLKMALSSDNGADVSDLIAKIKQTQVDIQEAVCSL